jgi:hypothetical protein
MGDGNSHFSTSRQPKSFVKLSSAAIRNGTPPSREEQIPHLPEQEAQLYCGDDRLGRSRRSKGRCSFRDPEPVRPYCTVTFCHSAGFDCFCALVKPGAMRRRAERIDLRNHGAWGCCRSYILLGRVCINPARTQVPRKMPEHPGPVTQNRRPVGFTCARPSSALQAFPHYPVPHSRMLYSG